MHSLWPPPATASTEWVPLLHYCCSISAPPFSGPRSSSPSKCHVAKQISGSEDTRRLHAEQGETEKSSNCSCQLSEPPSFPVTGLSVSRTFLTGSLRGAPPGSGGGVTSEPAGQSAFLTVIGVCVLQTSLCTALKALVYLQQVEIHC